MGDSLVVDFLLPCLNLEEEPDENVRGSAATALGALGDPSAVDPLILLLDPKKEPSPIVRGSAATALGALGDSRAVAFLLPCLDPERERYPRVRGSAATSLGALGDVRSIELIRLASKQEPDPIVKNSETAALRRIERKAKIEWSAPGDPDAKPAENAALQSLFCELLEDFFRLTETPLPSSFPRALELCLLAMEKFWGGANFRGSTEKDYQRVLATLLAKDLVDVVTEAEPADRERTDILVQLRDGSQAVLELKFENSSHFSQQLAQLHQYLASFGSGARPTTGHLILLDRNAYPAWGKEERRTETDGITVWRVHINRQPASRAQRPSER